MSQEKLTRYDDVLYQGHPYEETHFARLATLGSIYGLEQVPLSQIRVLELGCGSGINLISMAYQYPECQFIGVDLSGRAIEAGMTTVAELGLENVKLQHCDIMEVTAELGRFDYIIAHGVYSWVPPAARDKIMKIFSDHLSSRGIAYVSYNAYPGSHLRNLVRDMMLFHVRDFSEPTKQIAQARAILKMLSEATNPTSVHGAVMRDQFARIDRMSDMLLFHDDLDEVATAFLLHQVVDHAKTHGLQYLCDAAFSRRDLNRMPEGARKVLAQFPDTEFMARDQYQDFIEGYGFRSTLLCHADVRLNRAVEAECVARFHLSSSPVPVSDAFNLSDASAVEFKLQNNYTVVTDHPLSKAALFHLGKCWPAAVSYRDLQASARDILAMDVKETCSDGNIQALMQVLFDAARVGHAELTLYPYRLTTTISERPKTSQLARKQAETDTLVTNLRHKMIRLQDEHVRRLLMLVDGTRRIDQLVTDLRERTSDLPLDPDKPGVTRETVDMHLNVLAKLALLVA
jgi:methyltransferase-like protein/2-polyprenyl-3-methyl-5-hydroxy-6-metoxy-1,4-benzoquinol methylase